MKTAIYIRVSTEEQAKEGYSISAQMQKLRAFCISQGWEVAGIYTDEGISAKDMKRPDLKRMLDDIKAGEIECVLVYRLDRLTRSVLDLYKMLETFEKYDCKFKSATESYDTTTAMGRMFITLVAALAQWERENMGERISFGFAEKARQGKYAHNFAPLGYDLNKQESKLYINKEEAKTVKEIYRLYQSGLGVNRVSSNLNNRRIYTKAGNEWSDVTVAKTLNNHVYYGAAKWRDIVVEDTHQGIVSKDEWDNVQKIINERRNMPPRSVSSRYIFSGKLKCKSCGRNLSGNYTTSVLKNGVKKYMQYRCSPAFAGRCAGNRNVAESRLEIAFIDYLKKIDFDNVVEIADQGEEELNKNDNIDLSAIEKEIEKIESRKKKWQYAWTDDAISYDDFKKRMEEESDREEELEKQLALIDTEKEVPFIDKEKIAKLLKDIERNWHNLENMEKKNLVNSIVENIDYKHVDNRIVIENMTFK